MSKTRRKRWAQVSGASSSSARSHSLAWDSQPSSRSVFATARLRRVAAPAGITRLLQAGWGCSVDVKVPASIIPVNGTSPSLHTALGSTSRSVSAGPFSRNVDTSFSMQLETAQNKTLTDSIAISAPWPCNDQNLQFRFTRRNGDLL